MPRRSPKGEDGHALVADGLFVREGLFHVLPDVSLRPLEELFRAIEVFTPCDFIAAITPCPAVASEARRRKHIPDKSFQLVRYYGWYSNKMRGQRDKQAAAAAVQPDGKAAAVIDVSEHKPRRIPSKKWRELIKKGVGSRSAPLPTVFEGDENCLAH